jgi:hypothetical protein
MRLTILTTGGTIDKTYDEFQGSLRNSHTVLDVILDGLRIPDLFIRHVEVMHKDSLDMTEEDREIIAKAVCDAHSARHRHARRHRGVSSRKVHRPRDPGRPHRRHAALRVSRHRRTAKRYRSLTGFTPA